MLTGRKILASFAIALALASQCVWAQNAGFNNKAWQETKSIRSNFKAVSSQPDFDVFSAPNIIMIKVNKQTEVRLFTILGKLISSQTLKPGIYEYHLDSHGVYIIKTEDCSYKIAI